MRVQIHNLGERTGIYGLALFSRGNIADPSQPELLQSSGDPSRFFLEVLNLDIFDVLRRFELWATSQGESKLKYIFACV
jgi:hypothetical protein